RLGYGKTRSQARQLVNHGHVLVNNKKVDIPSYLLKIGQTISLKKKTLNKKNFSETIANNRKSLIPVSYLDYKKDSGVFVSLPAKDDLAQNVDISKVMEFYRNII
ncbi:MAG: S4 domain-containing protein, partial [Patescibacteria group bacterium]